MENTKKFLLFNKILLPILSFVAVLLLFFIIFAINNIYPFGELTVSWCDMNQQTIPLLCEFKDILSGKESFWLSQKNAGGMNFFGVYFFNLSSPFTYLVAFFDKADMPLAVNLMVVLKLSLAAAMMSVFLNYAVRGCSPLVVISLSISYAFSGYAMMYYQILSWLDILYVFPLVLIGLEIIKGGGKNTLYIISLFLCVLFHFYLSYAVVLFVCIYAAVHLILKKDGEFAKKFIIGSAIAAMLSAVVLLPCFLQYTHSMRTVSIFESLINSSFTPQLTTTLPTFFSLLMFIPFIMYNKGSFRVGDERDFYFILFAFMLIPVLIEPIAKAWQTFNYMSFPTRYGFITIALGLLLTANGLTQLFDKKSDEKQNCKICIKSDNSVEVLKAEEICGKNTPENKEDCIDGCKENNSRNGKNTDNGNADCKLKIAKNDDENLKRNKISRQVGIIFANVFILAFVICFARFSKDYFVKLKDDLTAFSQTLWGDEKSFVSLSIFYIVLLVFSIFLWLFAHYKFLRKIDRKSVV